MRLNTVSPSSNIEFVSPPVVYQEYYWPKEYIYLEAAIFLGGMVCVCYGLFVLVDSLQSLYQQLRDIDE